MPPLSPSGFVQFGKFRLLNRIADGGMGVVYRAEMDGPGGPRIVVVKRMRQELGSDPAFARMLAQEARVGALLRHPQLVPVLESGRIDDQLYLVLEHVDGYDLAQILDRAIRMGREIPVGVACFIAFQAAEALAYVHDLRDAGGQPVVIAHRDISPSNLMLTTGGTVKLLDFGIAKAADAHTDDRTRTGTMKGKLAYFSPEQAEGHSLDARSDLFSLGVVFMELLLERRLFRGTGDFDTLRRVREANVPRASTVRPEIEAELDIVLATLLQKDREARYASAHELVAALRGPLRRAGGSAEAAKQLLSELAPIERRTFVATPASGVSPAVEDETQLVDVRPVTPALGTSPSVPIVVPPILTTRAEARWERYLAQLPDGLRSYPEVGMKGAAVRSFYETFGSPPLPAGVPPEVRDVIDHPPPVSAFVPGCIARVLLLSCGDVLDLDDDTFVERAMDGNRKLLSGPLYGVMFKVLSTERLIRNVDTRWGSFHRGLEVSIQRNEKGRVDATITGPPYLDTPLISRFHVGALVVGLEKVGAKGVRAQLEVKAPGKTHVLITWT